jgi:hypothetical protein
MPFLLLILLLIKHCLADGIQSKWMVWGKRKGGFRFVLPLASHAGIHGGLTLLCVAFWFDLQGITGQQVLCFSVATFDFICHFTFDRSKAILERISQNKKYRVFLNIWDQILHISCYITISTQVC